MAAVVLKLILQRMDIFEALLSSHRTQRELCAQLLANIGEAQAREQTFDELKSELAVHATSEERAFYVPLIEHDETVDLSRHAIAEHHEMDEMVEALEETEAGSAEYLEAVGKLVHKVGHHLDEEEQKFFDQARRILPVERQQELGALYLEEHQRLQTKEAEA